MPYSDQFIQNAYNRNAAYATLILIRVNIDGSLYYYANNNESIQSSVSGSPQVYQQSRFSLELPEDSPEGSPQATIDFDSADIQVIRKLRAANSRVIIDLWLVLESNPDIAEFGPANYESVNFSVDKSAVSLSLQAEPILDVELPAKRYTPQTAPALWENND